jgi:hypothetical protein
METPQGEWFFFLILDKIPFYDGHVIFLCTYDHCISKKEYDSCPLSGFHDTDKYWNKDHNEENKTTLLLCLLSHIISLKWEVRLIKLGSPATFY